MASRKVCSGCFSLAVRPSLNFCIYAIAQAVAHNSVKCIRMVWPLNKFNECRDQLHPPTSPEPFVFAFDEQMDTEGRAVISDNEIYAGMPDFRVQFNARPRHGILTGPNYDSLTPEVKQIIDEAIATIKEHCGEKTLQTHYGRLMAFPPPGAQPAPARSLGRSLCALYCASLSLNTNSASS